VAVVFKNNAKTTLASGLTSSATSVTVADGSAFPSLSGGDTFFCTFDNGTNVEVVKVTARSSNTLTIVRAQDDTTARAFSTGDVAELRLTAGILNLFSQTGVAITDEIEAYLDANGLTFPDNVKAQFGAGNDLQIYHDGSHSYVRDVGTGNLKLQGTNLNLQNEGGTKNYLVAVNSGAVQLYHNNNSKIQTTSTGINVTGTVTADGLTVAGDIEQTTGDLKYTGGINWDIAHHGASQNIVFKTTPSGGSATEALRIDSSQNVIVGHSAADDTTASASLRYDGRIYSTVSADQCLSLNRLSSDGEIITFKKDSTIVGNIKSRSGDLIIHTGITGLRFNDNNDAIHPVIASGSVSYGATDLGLSNARFKDLYLSGKAYVGSMNVDAGNADGIKISSTAPYLFFNDTDTAHSYDGSISQSGTTLYVGGATPAQGIVFRNKASFGESARFNTSGDFLVSTTDNSPVGNNVAGGIALLSNGSGQFSRDGGTALLINRKTSDGELLRFNKNGSSVGSIGTYAGDIVIGTGDTGVRYDDNANALIPWNITNNTSTNGTIGLGYSTVKFTDLHLSGTISSGAITSTGTSTFGVATASSYKVGASTVIDNSRNLLNIGTISSGAITSSGLIQSNNSSAFTANGSSVILRAIAPAVESGHTTKHEINYGWASTNDRTYQAPKIDGTPNYNHEFGYNFASENWYFEDLLSVGTISSGAITANSSGTNTVTIDGTGTKTLRSYHDSGGVGWATGSGTSYANLLYLDDNNDRIRIYTEQAERLRINASGIDARTGGFRINATTVIDASRQITTNSRLTFGYNSHYFEAGTNAVSFKSGSGTNYLTINNTGLTTSGAITSSGNIFMSTNGSILRNTGGALQLQSDASQVILRSNNTTALTLDTSQNATFAGNVTVTGTVTATGGNSTNWNTAYGWGNHASQSYATESYVGTQISNLVDSSPAALNTLNELAAALGDDANFSTTVTNSIATKLPLAGGTMTGTLAMGANAITSTGTISSGTANVGGLTATGAVLIDVDNLVNGALRITANQTNPDNDFYFAQEIVSTLSGTTATTADREQGGLYLDINSTATGGDTSNEHRAYGVYVDLDSTGDADLIAGGYFNATATPTTGQTTEVIGIQAIAEDNGGAGAINNVYGAKLIAQSDNSTSDTNLLYGSYSRVTNLADSGAITKAIGVYGEVELASGSGDIYGTTYVIESQYDNNTGISQTHTSALFFGNYAGELPTTAYGVYIPDAVRNRFDGSITTGRNSTTTASYGFNSDLNTGMYSPADHELGFLTNGGQRLKLDSTGATVTGTISSGAITSSAKITANSSIDVIGATGQSGFIYIYDRDNGTATTDGFLLQKSGNSAFVYNRESSGNLSLGAGNTSNYFVITSTGAIQLGSTQILDQSRNLTNIGTISSGAITSTATQATLRNSSGVTLKLTTNGSPGSVSSKLPLHIDFNGYGQTTMARVRSWDESSSTADGFLEFFTNNHVSGSNSLRRVLLLDNDRNATFDGTISSGKLTVNSGADVSQFHSHHTTGHDDWQVSPISIRERGLNTNNSTNNQYSPNLNFHWASVVSRSLTMTSDGNFTLGEWTASGTPSMSSSLSFLNTAGYKVNNTTVIDSSRNLTNIGTISSGGITSSGKFRMNLGANPSPATTDYLYIGGDDLGGSDAAIYLGNRGNGTGYGWRFFYEGSGNSNNNKLIIKSENLGSPVDALSFTQDGNATFAGTIGIGVSPSSPLHVKVGTNQNLEVDSDGSELRLSAVNDARSTNPAIRFQAESYKFYGAGGVGPRATIDSSGNLLVGKTSIGSDSVGFQAASNGKIAATVSGSETARFNRTSSDGDIVQFRKDDATVGSIGTNSGLFISSTYGTDSGLRFASSIIAPSTTTGANRDAAIDLGYSSSRFKDLHLSGSTSTGDLKIGSTTVINGGRQLTNIASANVAGNITVDYTGNGTNDAGIFIQNDNNDWGLRIHKTGTSTHGMQIDADGAHAFRTVNSSGVEKFRIDGDGDIETVRNITSTGDITTSNVQINSNGIYLLNGNYRVGTTAIVDSNRNLINIGTITASGNIQHTGLTMTSGSDIDQLYSVTKSLTLSTSWQDTGIIFNNLSTGSYMVQVTVNDHAVGGQHYSEMYTGVLSWYSSGTNSTATDEILLHRAGHAPNNGDIFLRTARVAGNTSPNLHMEIRGALNNTGASNYAFKFRRLI